MLHFILGGVGAGKTTAVENMIGDYSGKEEVRMTLIVPEQFAFTCQKKILTLVGAKKMPFTDVLSFKSLGEKLIGMPSSLGKRRLSDSSACAFMSLALKSVKDSLQVYGRSAENPSAVREFLSLSSELKQNLVSPDMLRDAADKMESGLLKAKLCDIAAVLTAYNERIENSYFDPEDLISELSSCAALDAYFGGRIVFIDSFRGFTAGQYAVIERIMKSARDVWVTLCTDSADEDSDITDFFAKTKNTALRLTRIAKDNGIEVDSPVILSACGEYSNASEGFERYFRPELSYLEYAMRMPAPAVYSGECGGITLCKAANTYLECEYVAATIKRLIREENFRYRDIAVIARDIGSYRITLTSALKKYGIKIYEDYRKSVDVSPVMNVLSACLHACADNFSNESVMRYLKTGLAGMDVQDISLLENYCYTWQISGKKWLSEWTRSPDGYTDSERIDEKDTARRLEKLNRLRVSLITPLLALRQALSGGVPGPQAVEAIWKFFTAIKLSDNVKAMAAALAEDGENSAVLELRRTWKMLVDILDELYGVLENEKVTASFLSSITDLMLSADTMGTIPQELDGITIGSADRIRISSPRVAFVIGVNEGIFPPEVKPVSALTVRERAKLETLGIKLSDSGEWRIAEENIIAYCSLCCPKDRLYVTCSLSTADGSELHPGDLYRKIRTVFPEAKEYDAASLPGEYYAQDKPPAFEQLAKSEPGVFRETLKKYFASKEEYTGRIAALQRAQGGRNFKILDREIAAELFGRDMYISPSRIEKYYQCAFSYFCKYGIYAAPRKPAELDNLLMGNIRHKVIERLLREHSREELLAMDDAQVKAAVRGYMDDYFKDVLGSPDDSRLIYLFNRVGDALVDTAKTLIAEFEYCSFSPVDFELSIDRDGDIPPYLPEDGDGCFIRGKVDRLDICRDGGSTYFRIIDYKSLKKEFDINKAVHGLDLQMLVYLFAIWQNGGERYDGNLTPAAVLYRNVTDEALKPEDIARDGSATKARLRAHKMNGIILRDMQAANLMEKGCTGLLLPAKIDKNGELSGFVINLDGLIALKKRTDKLINDMAALLRGGNIEAVPYRIKDSLGFCKNCDYRAVCGFEDSIESRPLPEAKKEDVIADLENGGDGDVGTVE